MTEPSIRVEHISKRYRIGASARMHDKLRDALVAWARAPLANYRRLKGLTQFGDDEANVVWALRDVSFEVAQGEVLGIVGRNGAGKSTMLKILSRIATPTSGRAVIRGRVSSLLEVGTGFHHELTGRQNVYLAGTILGMTKAEVDRKFDSIAEFSEVERFLETPVKWYSSGMRVRLAFAVAAHLEPEVMLIDEVLSVGDAAFQEKCLNKIREIVFGGRTVLVVSHNLASIRNLCERAMLFEGGRIAAHGPVDEVVDRYLASTPSARGTIEWSTPEEAPGLDEARVHRVRILQPGRDEGTAEVDIARDVLVEVTYWSLSKSAPIHVAVLLSEQHGTAVFSSVNLDSVGLGDDSRGGRPHPVGLYRATCAIPAHLLNDRTYSVKVGLGLGRRMETLAHPRHYLEQTSLTFTVLDTGAMRRDYYGNWLGVMRPRLAWESRQLE